MVANGSILITGASSGIGRECAMSLAQIGFEIFAGVRKESDGVVLQTESKGKVLPVRLDVTDPAAITDAVSKIGQIVGNRGLCGVINNAGICVVGPVEFFALSEWRRQFEVNFFGAIAVTQAALPLLRMHVAKHGKGAARLINISSIAGKIAQPILGPYTASKHAMESLTDSLRMELKPQGIQVCSINPGAIDTPIWGKAQVEVGTITPDHPSRVLYADLIDGITAAAAKAQASAVPASKVADAVIACMTKQKPSTRYFVGREAKSSVMAKWLLSDRMFDAILARVIKMEK